MTEEEKKAIEELIEFRKGPCEICTHCRGAYKLNRENIIVLLNLIEKQQKEIEELKQENEYLNCICESDDDEKNIEIIRNMIINMQKEIEEIKSKIKEIMEEELPDDEIMKVCSMYDVNGIEIRRKLEQLLESEGLL